MTPEASAALLLAARNGGPAVPWATIAPASAQEAYAVQDATLAGLSPIAGWKVGAKGPLAEPICAPLPAAGLLPSGVRLVGPAWALRGVEVELALRLGRDLDVDPNGPCDVRAAFDAVLPAIEVVETRLADWKGSPAPAQLADLQSHGALVLGAPSAVDPSRLDLRTLRVQLQFDGHPVAGTLGGNPAADLWRLLGWLAQHCARRGQPLRKGQVVTTGSCTGMQFAAHGTAVRGEIEGLGAVDLVF